MTQHPLSVPPPPLLAAITALGKGLLKGSDSDALRMVLSGLSALPASRIVTASRQISAHMSIGLQPSDLLAADPNYAWLFLFHYGGHVREAALDAIPEPPTSPFFFAALAWRLNDWVPQVRQAAIRCADRVLPGIESAVAAAAAFYLLARLLAWGRWGDEQQALHDVFGRADVAAMLVRELRHGTTGKLALCLRQALRYPSIDEHLEDLMAEAIQPAVRAAALQTLISGKATWPQGLAWAWIDKVYGLKRQVIAYGSREIRRATQPAQLITEGIRDRSPIVRWVAAGALMEVQEQLPNADALIAELANDKSPALRARAEFMRQRMVC